MSSKLHVPQDAVMDARNLLTDVLPGRCHNRPDGCGGKTVATPQRSNAGAPARGSVATCEHASHSRCVSRGCGYWRSTRHRY